MGVRNLAKVLSRAVFAAAFLLSACSDADLQPADDRLVTLYFGIFNDGQVDNFHPCLDLHPPYELWDVTLIAFVHTYEGDGVYVADYENARGLDSQSNPIPPAPGDTDRDRIRQLVEAATAVNPRMKFVITLGWGHDDFSNGAKTPVEFAASVGRIVEENGLDGFDVDFEDTVLEASEFVAVTKALRAELDARGKAMGKPLLLTFTPNNLINVDLATVNEYYDLVQMQSYSASVDDTFDPSEVVGKGVDGQKILFGRDIESGDTLEALRYGIPDVTEYVIQNGLRGLTGWRVNSGTEMTQTNPFSGVKLLGNAFKGKMGPLR